MVVQLTRAGYWSSRCLGVNAYVSCVYSDHSSVLFTRAAPEELSHRTHAEDDMQVVPDPLDQITEHGVWSLQHVVFLGRICQSVANLQEGQRMVMRQAEDDLQTCEV